MRDVFGDVQPTEIMKIQKETINKISEHMIAIRKKVKDLVEIRKEANSHDDIVEKANMYSSRVKPYLEEIRYHIDKLELIIDDEMWPLPKYRELLFTR